MLKTYEYRIYPNKEQAILIAKHFGCTRFVYNKALALKISLYEKEKKTISKFELNKEITKWKKEETTCWLKEVQAQSLQQAMTDLDSAFIRFFREKKGFPKFKSKHTYRYSYRSPQGNKINFENKKIFLPKIGWIKTRIDRTFVGEIHSVTLKQVPSGKYFVSVLIKDETENKFLRPIKEETTIGIDLGIKDFAVLSTGEKIPNPRALKENLKKLQVLQHRMSRKAKGSNNRNKARIKVAKQYEKVTNIRKDFLHKLSSRLTNESQVDTICLETLNISGMMKNHRLAQAMGDVSWYSFIQMLTYKAERNGVNILRIGQFEPSSKTCTCGYINKNLTLRDRNWICPNCGTHHDRDILAANNIKRIALADLNLKYQNSGLGKSVELVESLTLVKAMKQEQ